MENNLTQVIQIMPLMCQIYMTFLSLGWLRQEESENLDPIIFGERIDIHYEKTRLDKTVFRWYLYKLTHIRDGNIMPLNSATPIMI